MITRSFQVIIIKITGRSACEHLWYLVAQKLVFGGGHDSKLVSRDALSEERQYCRWQQRRAACRMESESVRKLGVMQRA